MKIRRITVSLLLAMAMTVASVFPQSVMAMEQPTDTAETTVSWADEIDSMLQECSYVEGEVIALVDNTLKAESTTEECGEVEDLTQVSADSIEEVFEEDADSVVDEEEYSDSTVQLIVSEDKTTEELLRELANDPSVVYAAPNYIKEMDYDTDTYTSLDNGAEEGNGEEGGSGDEKGDSKIVKISEDDISEAHDMITEKGYESVSDLTKFQWGYTEYTDDLSMCVPRWNEKATVQEDGTKEIHANVEGSYDNEYVVAICDSGVDYTHPDLQSVMVSDMRKYNSRGGQYGYNATSSNDGDPTDPMDDNMHGTHCAGVVASSWDGVGVSGVASGVKICAVKIGGKEGNYQTADVLDGFRYLCEAVDNGMKLLSINCSFGGEMLDHFEMMMIRELGKRGVVVCMAAGNSDYDNDERLMNNAVYNSESNVIGVCASTPTYQKAAYSQWGQTTEDVFAPGDAILSTVSKEGATYMAWLDDSGVYKEDFNGETQTVKIYKTTKTQFEEQDILDLLENGETVGEVYTGDSIDGDGHSLRIDVSDHAATSYYIMAIPIAQEDISKVYGYGTGTKAESERARITVAPLAINYLNIMSEAEAVQSQRPSRVWANNSVSLESVFSNNGSIAYVDGYLLFSVKYEEQSEDNPGDYFYLDSIGLGNQMVRYGFLQGTSMATPSVTGAVAIIYGQLLTYGNLGEKTPEERATFVANYMKGMTYYSEEYDGLCTSNGYVNFKASGIYEQAVDWKGDPFDKAPEEMTPVINSVTLDEDNLLVLKGSYFGDGLTPKPVVTLDGETLTVKSFSDNKIVAELPEDFTSGRHSIYVTGQDGKKGTRKAVLQLNDDTSSLGNVVTPPQDIDYCEAQIAAIGKYVYVAPGEASTVEGGELIFQQLWRYDTEADSWEQLASIPISGNAKKVQMPLELCNYNGTLVAAVQYNGDDNKGRTDLWFYVPSENAWVQGEFTEENIPVHYGIGTSEQGLLMAGGSVYKTVVAEDGTSSTESTGNKTIYRIVVPENISAASGETIKLSIEEVGTLLMDSSTPQISASGDDILVHDEWMRWSSENNKYELVTTVKYGDNNSGKYDLPAEYESVMTPYGVMACAITGAAYEGRSYDTVIISEDGTRTAFAKYISFEDIRDVDVYYNDSMLYIWGTNLLSDTMCKLYYGRIAESKEPETVQFSDVTDSSKYYYAPVYWAAEKGITKGYSDGTFGVGRSCTREEFTLFLYRLFGCPEASASASDKFADVKDSTLSNGFKRAIAWASSNGIIKGYSDGTFGVGKSITRQQAMIMIWRAAGKPAAESTEKVQTFTDVAGVYSAKSDTYNAIAWAAAKGITKGYTKTENIPAGYEGLEAPCFGCVVECTREAMITFLYRYAKIAS